MLSSSELTDPTEDLNILSKKYQLMVYYADSLFDDACYKRAEVIQLEKLQQKGVWVVGCIYGHAFTPKTKLLQLNNFNDANLEGKIGRSYKI